MLDMDLIINRMIAKRKELGWTQRDFADRVGVSFEYVNKIESKRHFPSLPMLERMAEALELSSRDIFLGADAGSTLYLLSEINGHYTTLGRNTKAAMRNTLQAMDEIDAALKRNRRRFS